MGNFEPSLVILMHLGILSLSKWPNIGQIIYPSRAAALVYWLWEMTVVQEVVGSNTIYWIDMTWICCKICIFCLKRPIINKGEAGVGPFKKSICLVTLVLLPQSKKTRF